MHIKNLETQVGVSAPDTNLGNEERLTSWAPKRFWYNCTAFVVCGVGTKMCGLRSVIAEIFGERPKEKRNWRKSLKERRDAN